MPELSPDMNHRLLASAILAVVLIVAVSVLSVALKRARNTYSIHDGVDVHPHVYYRITDNWVELTLRFISPVHGTRTLKDAMSRDILAQFDAAGIGIASGTYEIVGVPPVRVLMTNGETRTSSGASAGAST